MLGKKKTQAKFNNINSNANTSLALYFKVSFSDRESLALSASSS